MNLKATALLGAVFFGAFVTAQAQLAWEKNEIELHPKAGDATAVANFKYQNKGKTPIKITSVKSSCGCTVASLKKDVVDPGEKGEVTATFNIGGRTGVQQKAITVQTDDASQPVINLMLKAVIEQPIEIQPTFVFWQAGEAPKAKTVKVKVSKDVNAAKLDVVSSNPEFTAKMEQDSTPGEYTLSVQPKDTAKPLEGTITIKSDLPQPYIITVRVTGPAAAGR
jgi:hypothetical protein